MPSLPSLVLKFSPDGRSISALTLYLLVLPDATLAWPYSSARLAVPEPRSGWLTLILFCAVIFSWLADHEIVSLTLMSPSVPLPPETL